MLLNAAGFDVVPTDLCARLACKGAGKPRLVHGVDGAACLPHRQPVPVPVRHGRPRLHSGRRVALGPVGGLEGPLGRREPAGHIAPLQDHGTAGDQVAPRMDSGRAGGQRRLGVQDVAEHLVFDGDGPQRVLGHRLGLGGDRGYLISHVADNGI